MCKFVLKITGVIILLTISLIGLAQKTDKVYLRNGNMLTGEIKSMKFAKLLIDVDGPGKIDIKWEYIVKIESNKTLQITLRNGEVYVTTMDSLFSVVPYTTLYDVVEIVRIKDKFIKRLDGSVNLGFNYAKSSDNAQFTFSSITTYRKPKAEVTLKLNSVLTHNSSDTAVSRKQDAAIDFYKKLKNSWYLNSLFGWQQNSQLGLKSRFLLNGSGGKIIVNSNQQRLLTGAGLSFNVEDRGDSTGYKSNLEGLFMIQYKKFRYIFPKMTIDAQYILYPGLTDWGRVRMDLQVNTSYEFFKDFNVGLSFYDSYDNRPSAKAASTNDFGINFTIGYTFGK
jgi:Protein of unknown function, DUF481